MKKSKIICFLVMANLVSSVWAVQLCPTEMKVHLGKATPPGGWYLTQHDISSVTNPRDFYVNFTGASYNYDHAAKENNGRRISCTYYTSNRLVQIEITSNQTNQPEPAVYPATMWEKIFDHGYACAWPKGLSVYQCYWG